MTRSQAMRGKSVYGSISTAFMSEPTLSYNLVLKAYTDYTTELRTTGDKKKAWNNAKGKVAWALATYLCVCGRLRPCRICCGRLPRRR